MGHVPGRRKDEGGGLRAKSRVSTRRPRYPALTGHEALLCRAEEGRLTISDPRYPRSQLRAWLVVQF